MAGFRITRPYTMPKEEILEAAEALAEDLTERFRLSCRWDGDDRVSLKGSGASGELVVDDEAITVSVKLGLLAMAFEQPLKEEVNRFLDEHLY